MYWEEDKSSGQTYVIDDVVDLVFGIACKSLAVDHMHALSASVLTILPWLSDEPKAGLHSIHVAASGNGWQRPEEPDALLYLSRRTKLELRVPAHRVEDARRLEGCVLDVDGFSLEVKTAVERPMTKITTLLSRYVASDENIDDEELLLEWVAEKLQALDIVPRKMLCGTGHVLRTPEGKIYTRSLMLANLEIEESLRLQKFGLGPSRHLGCGLFLPHKHIDDLREKKE